MLVFTMFIHNSQIDNRLPRFAPPLPPMLSAIYTNPFQTLAGVKSYVPRNNLL